MNRNIGIVERESYTLVENKKIKNVGVACYAIQDHKAITLVSLIITIIVMLILAGVTLSIAFGENGLFTQTKLAMQKYENARLREEQELQNATNMMLDLGVASNRDNLELSNEELKTLVQGLATEVNSLKTQVTEYKGKIEILEGKIENNLTYQQMYIPDYENGEVISFSNKSYVVQENGFIQIHFEYASSVDSGIDDEILINNKLVSLNQIGSKWNNIFSSIIPVKAGDTVTYTNTAQNVTCYFYPIRH